jgi:hypothetical protein
MGAGVARADFVGGARGEVGDRLALWCFSTGDRVSGPPMPPCTG